MLAYNRDRAKKSLAYKRFKKYFLKGMHFSKEKKMRLFFSKAEGTIVIYTKIVKDYVRYMHRKENRNAFPVTETSLRRYIDNMDLEKDRGKFPNLKAAMIFVKRLRNEPEMSFNSTDLVLEGLLREVGARFKPKKIKTDNVNELNVRKLLLRALYGKSFKEPYNDNMIEFRTGLRCLTSLFCLSRCEDYRELQRSDVIFELNNVIIIWGKKKNNQKSKPQQSLVPKLPDHPLCLYSAFEHYFQRTQLPEDYYINCSLSRYGRPGKKEISRSTCYTNMNALCKELKIDNVTEKMCKSLGTRYLSIILELAMIIIIKFRMLVDSELYTPEAVSEIGLWKSVDSHRNYYKISRTIRKKAANTIAGIDR